MFSGSRRDDSAVEPTRSQIITVRWRRSASECRGASAIPSSCAIARRSFRRCPSRTPRSLRSCSVRSPMTERSIALSAKRWAYSDKPSCPSQSAIFCIATFPALPRSRMSANREYPKKFSASTPLNSSTRTAPGSGGGRCRTNYDLQSWRVHAPGGNETECPCWVCAVIRRRFPVGASPTRQPLQPEATGAVMEATKWLKPSVSVSRIGDSASVHAVTRVNAEQASKRTMRRPTRRPFRGRRRHFFSNDFNTFDTGEKSV